MVVALVSAPSTVPAAESCAVRGSRTEAVNRHVRVYISGGNYYACAYETGRIFEVGARPSSCDSSGGCEGVQRVAIAGYFVAWTYFLIEGRAPPVDSGDIYVRDVRTGRFVHQHHVGSFEEGDAEVGLFRLTRTGAVGYIVKRSPYDSHTRLTEIWRMDRRGRARLDRGYSISRSYLRLRDGRLTWQRGRAHRTSRLT